MRNWKNRHPNQIPEKLDGKEFGQWTVLHDHPTKKRWVVCKCSCGNICERTKADIKNSSRRCNNCRLKYYKGNKNHQWKGYEGLPLSTFNHFKHNAELREIQFDLTIEFLWELYVKQEGKCAISGLPISFKTNKRGQKVSTASLDRIDSTLPYVRNNVQWLHKDVNLMKWKLDQKYFIELCLIIAKKENDARA